MSNTRRPPRTAGSGEGITVWSDESTCASSQQEGCPNHPPVHLPTRLIPPAGVRPDGRRVTEDGSGLFPSSVTRYSSIDDGEHRALRVLEHAEPAHARHVRARHQHFGPQALRLLHAAAAV